MRIVHISDIHLSKNNQDSFNRFYFNALLKDLKEWDSIKKIDLIFLTGDLIDKGGKSLGNNPYLIIEEVFINQLVKELPIKKQRIIILPGNHDVDESMITDISENGLIALDSIQGINKYVDEHRNLWHEGIERIKAYKDFEKRLYSKMSNFELDKDYRISNFESCFIFNIDGLSVGVAAFNSAWRCSTSLPHNKLLLGTSQILQAKEFFNSGTNKTNINIALIHHPIEAFSSIEQSEIHSFLSVFDFHIVLCGHTHAVELINSIGISQNLFVSVAKSAFSNPREPYDTYKPGFSIMDINMLNSGQIEIATNFRKYIHKRIAFDKDVDASKDGFYKTVLFRTLNLPTDYQTQELETNVGKPLIDAWNKITDILINNSFPDIGARIGDLIRQSLLPNRLERYNKDLKMSYEIKLVDENHFKIVETQIFYIISTENSFNLEYYLYIEKTKDIFDKSDITLEKFLVDQVDCNIEDNVSIINKSTKDIKHKAITIKKELKGQKRYSVEITTHSVHSLKLNGIWQYNVNTITQNLSLSIRNIDNFEIDLIKVGNNSTNFLETSPFLDTKIINYENLLMPGEGFIFVIKRKSL